LVFSAVALTLSGMIQNACRQTGLRFIVLSGGVIQNSIIRRIIESRLETESSELQLCFAPREYAGDNAAGLASLCRLKYYNRQETACLAKNT
jgi:tRNA A37 threonylcarbamoyltransferase TsaD